MLSSTAVAEPSEGYQTALRHRAKAMGLEVRTLQELSSGKNANCPTVQPVKDLNLDEWIRASWFVQKQQVVEYQPVENNFCTVATYESEGATVPFFGGKVISVYNYGKASAVDGEGVGAVKSDDPFTLCARLPDEDKTSELIVAPCFLPNALGGDYWVIAAGPSNDNYEWALVSGGQPDVRYADGCTTGKKTNGGGLWMFSRKPVADKETIDMMLNVLKEKGYTTSLLNDVVQEGCSYDDMARCKGDSCPN